jgi:hypothetical protein
MVLLQAAVLAALVSLRGSELAVQAQGSAWAARALFFLEGAVGDLAMFPFQAALAAFIEGGHLLPPATAMLRWLWWH